MGDAQYQDGPCPPGPVCGGLNTWGTSVGPGVSDMLDAAQRQGKITEDDAELKIPLQCVNVDRNCDAQGNCDDVGWCVDGGFVLAGFSGLGHTDEKTRVNGELTGGCNIPGGLPAGGQCPGQVCPYVGYIDHCNHADGFLPSVQTVSGLHLPVASDATHCRGANGHDNTCALFSDPDADANACQDTGVNLEDRVDCGVDGTTKDECHSYGCCWHPAPEGSPGGTPWCFLPSNRTPPAQKNEKILAAIRQNFGGNLQGGYCFEAPHKDSKYDPGDPNGIARELLPPIPSHNSGFYDNDLSEYNLGLGGEARYYCVMPCMQGANQSVTGACRTSETDTQTVRNLSLSSVG